jgi:hypothetical protein
MVPVYSIHATKKLLDRVKAPALPPIAEPANVLGNWYANALFWKPQVVLLVNERTLLPVLMPLAPAATVTDRFPESLERVLLGIGAHLTFVASEIAAMGGAQYAKTANRSVLGSMNDMVFMANVQHAHNEATSLLETSLWLAQTPCSPLDHSSPDREVQAIAAGWRDADPDHRRGPDL